MESKERNRTEWVTAWSDPADREMAWEIGQAMQRENSYDEPPVPAPDDWFLAGAAEVTAIVRVVDGRPVALIVSEWADESAILPGPAAWDDTPLVFEPVAEPSSELLMTYLYVVPHLRGTGAFRLFYDEVSAVLANDPLDIAHLGPFTAASRRFHRLDDPTTRVRLGTNWRHGSRPAQVA